MGLGTERTVSTRASALPLHENPTDEVTVPRRRHHRQAPSGIPQHANVQANDQTNSRSQQHNVMGANVPVMPTPIACRR